MTWDVLPGVAKVDQDVLSKMYNPAPDVFFYEGRNSMERFVQVWQTCVVSFVQGVKNGIGCVAPGCYV